MNNKPFDPDAFLRLNHAERKAILAELRAEIRQQLGITPPTPVEPPVTEVKTPTKRMKKALDRFNAMTDADQVDHLRGMWGEA